MTTETEKVNILCLKWGTRYGAEYVNRLYRGVSAHLHRPFRFVCVTDDSSGLVKGIDAQPFPPPPPGWTRNWPDIFVKLCVFQDGFAGLSGPTLFLDIDQIIVGDLDCFFDYCPSKFCIIRNWIEFRKRLFRHLPKVGNSSCFRYDAGSSDVVYRRFLLEMSEVYDRSKYRTEQAYMTHAVGFENVNWWPKNWVVSFKRACQWPWPLNHFLVPRRPKKANILCFHGKPDPDDAITGYRGKHLNTWVLPTPWVKELW